MSEQVPSWKSNRPVSVENLVRGYMVKKAVENPRKFDTFHPSAWGSCLRKIAYEYYNERKKFVDRKAFDIVPQMERIFDNGHYAHARWQKYLSHSNVLRGYWKCTNPLCGAVYGKEDRLGTFSPARLSTVGARWKCKCGNDKGLAYEEIFVKSEEYNFAGNVDAVVDVRGTQFQQREDLDVFVVDFKTIKDEMYSELLDPKHEHVVQVNIYMWLLDLRAAVVLYENKDCVPEFSRILTKRGWLYHHQLNENDEILTYSLERGVMEWEPFTSKVVRESRDDVVSIGNKHARFLCTDRHRWVVKTQRGKKYEVKTTEALNTNNWICRVAPHVFPEKSILTSREADVLGWIVTDGWITKRKGKPVSYYICQKVGHKTNEIRNLLGEDATYHEYLDKRKDMPLCKMAYFRLKPQSVLCEHLLDVYQSKQDFPVIVTHLNKKAAQAMYSSMLQGDGSWNSTGTKEQFCQRDGSIKEGFQILSFLLGRILNINKGKLSSYPALRPYLRAYPKQIYKVPYQGKVWCPVTKNGTWIMEQDGKCSITGNSQSLKEMFVPRDDKLIEEIKTQALWLKDVLQAQKLPPKPSGFSRSKYPCRKCDFLNFCYH